MNGQPNTDWMQIIVGIRFLIAYDCAIISCVS